MKQHPHLLIIGARGMLGQDLMDEFAAWKPIGWDRDEIDITDAAATEQKITSLNPRPDVIINSAAFTNVDACETEKDACMNVNGEGVGNIAAAAEKIGATVVHFSTDYVFDGTRTQGYDEDDREHLGPLSMYGVSKLRGETLLQEQTDRAYIIRTAWLYGARGKNFVDTMLKLASERDTLSVVNDQHGRPTFTRDLARQVRAIVEKKAPFGIYHVTNSGECTWFEFAQEIFRQTNTRVTVNPCTTAEFPRPARRPEYSVLNNTKLKPLRSWKAALKDYLNNYHSHS